MSELGIHTEKYHIDGSDVPVTWESYDFSKDVSGIPNEHIRTVLLDSGVMYVASADPKIRVSNLLDLDLQGLSAAHEELCQEQEVARCSIIEGLVIDAISNPELRTKFINMRLQMFGALSMLYLVNQEFAASRQLLAERSSSS